MLFQHVHVQYFFAHLSCFTTSLEFSVFANLSAEIEMNVHVASLSNSPAPLAVCLSSCLPLFLSLFVCLFVCLSFHMASLSQMSSCVCVFMTMYTQMMKLNTLDFQMFGVILMAIK